MTRQFIFADEAGCFTFKQNGRASRYFVVCTVVMKNCAVGADLLDLRRELTWDGHFHNEAFHATADPNPIRSRVFQIISAHDFRIDATLLEKRKAMPEVRPDNPTFYKYGWYYHLKYLVPAIIGPKTELFISAASLETNATKAAFKAAVNEVAQQTIKRNEWCVTFPQANSDPCLQVADYCAWAIQRKWERDDDRWFDFIGEKVKSEFDLWKNEKTFYY